MSKSDRLRVRRVLHVPLKEVSGICLHRGTDLQRSLIAVGDKAATLASIGLAIDDGVPEWRTVDLSAFTDSELPRHDPQIEAICADGFGNVLILQEEPPRAEVLDLGAARAVASIELVIEEYGELARSWSDPRSSHGEGAVLLAGGHLLVAKEKDPAALIEFGPPGAVSLGLAGGALADGTPWPVAPGRQRFVALAVWLPDKALKKKCEDFSDLEIGPDGEVYLLSDKSQSIARLEHLAPGGGTASFRDVWELDDLDDKPEGLAFTACGRAVVGLDRKKARNNLLILDPPIAPPKS